MAPRVVRAELLDVLPQDDPRAIRSRADLARVNGFMATSRIFAALVGPAHLAPPARWLDIGCGDGRLVLRLARRMAPSWPARGKGPPVLMLADRQAIVTPATRAGLERLGWRVECLIGDVFDLLRDQPVADLVTANLFLHHFEPAPLAALLAAAAARSRTMAFVEPRRGWMGLVGSRLIWLIGGNAVTRHDALASVQAGFAGAELAAALPAGWRVLREGRAGLFSHVLLAQRSEDDGPAER